MPTYVLVFVLQANKVSETALDVSGPACKSSLQRAGCPAGKSGKAQLMAAKEFRKPGETKVCVLTTTTLHSARAALVWIASPMLTSH